MVNWVFIGIILLAVVLFFKITSFKYEKWWTYSIGLLIVFVLFSFFSVVRTNGINLSSFEGFASGMKAYVSWLVTFGKTTASITGDAALFDWNVTNNASG